MIDLHNVAVLFPMRTAQALAVVAEDLIVLETIIF
jgi:hypothetical protein